MTRIEHAREYRAKIDQAATYLPDDKAFSSADLFPLWSGESVNYALGDRRRFSNKLYKCQQAHTSQGHYTPDMIPAIWIVVSDGSKSGTKDSPINAARGMEYVKDLYYLDPEDGKTYLCTREGVLQYLPHELIGIYFSLA